MVDKEEEYWDKLEKPSIIASIFQLLQKYLIMKLVPCEYHGFDFRNRKKSGDNCTGKGGCN